MSVHAEKVSNGGGASSGQPITDSITSKAHDTVDRLARTSAKAERDIELNPLLSVGIAFAAGILLSALLQR